MWVERRIDFFCTALNALIRNRHIAFTLAVCTVPLLRAVGIGNGECEHCKYVKFERYLEGDPCIRCGDGGKRISSLMDQD